MTEAQSISIHALLAESDGYGQYYIRALGISIHALLAESDRILLGLTLHEQDFYPRSPCGERLGMLDFSDNRMDISIHALLAESDHQASPAAELRTRFLSTLSLRRATPSKTRRLTNLIISIHALLAESDLALVYMICPPRDFYPRSPCGERPKF